MNIQGSWDIELETKPDLAASLERIYAWFEQEILDRPPIRFVSNNQVKRDSLSDPDVGPGRRWETYRDRWYDAEYRILVRNPKGVNRGVQCIEVDGVPMEGNRISYAPGSHEVTVLMG